MHWRVSGFLPVFFPELFSLAPTAGFDQFKSQSGRGRAYPTPISCRETCCQGQLFWLMACALSQSKLLEPDERLQVFEVFAVSNERSEATGIAVQLLRVSAPPSIPANSGSPERWPPRLLEELMEPSVLSSAT